MGRRVMTAASNCPKALIVSALAGFVRSFLMSDVAMLQDMGYEVHCAANEGTVYVGIRKSMTIMR